MDFVFRFGFVWFLFGLVWDFLLRLLLLVVVIVVMVVVCMCVFEREATLSLVVTEMRRIWEELMREKDMIKMYYMKSN